MDYGITSDEFNRFRTLIYDESGISLGDQKQTLLASRLSKRLRDLGLTTFTEYYEQVTGDTSKEEFTRMLDLISTNKTDFFESPSISIIRASGFFRNWPGNGSSAFGHPPARPAKSPTPSP